MTPEIRNEIVKYRTDKAYKLLEEVEVLLDNGLYNSAVNRMYYACFHSVSALMVKNGIENKSHKGLRHLFGLHFVKKGIISNEDARIFARIYDKRQASDYDDFMEFEADEVNALHPQVIRFVHQITNIIKS